MLNMKLTITSTERKEIIVYSELNIFGKLLVFFKIIKRPVKEIRYNFVVIGTTQDLDEMCVGDIISGTDDVLWCILNVIKGIKGTGCYKIPETSQIKLVNVQSTTIKEPELSYFNLNYRLFSESSTSSCRENISLRPEFGFGSQ